jgi:hypothetical protein
MPKKAYEISVWKPHTGKMEEFLTLYSEVKQLLLDHGVSQVDVITGVAGRCSASGLSR